MSRECCGPAVVGPQVGAELGEGQGRDRERGPGEQCSMSTPRPESPRRPHRRPRAPGQGEGGECQGGPASHREEGVHCSREGQTRPHWAVTPTRVSVANSRGRPAGGGRAQLQPWAWPSALGSPASAGSLGRELWVCAPSPRVPVGAQSGLHEGVDGCSSTCACRGVWDSAPGRKDWGPHPSWAPAQSHKSRPPARWS